MIAAEEVQELFRANGFEVTAKKVVSIDVIEIIIPLLRMLQATQFWGELCSQNGIKFPHKLDSNILGFAIHAADTGQDVLVARFDTPNDVLNLPKTLYLSLRRYGEDPEIRAQRIDDADLTQIMNENLDEHGATLLHLLSLVMPSTSRTPPENL